MIDAEALVKVQGESYRRAGQSLTGSWPADSAMTAAQLRSLLEERHYCVLATTGAKGQAIARPVAFCAVGASFWFATVEGPRLRNLERQPWVSVVIEDGERGHHRAMVVDGRVMVRRQPPAPVLDLWRTRHGSPAAWAAAWAELVPERIFSYRADQAVG